MFCGNLHNPIYRINFDPIWSKIEEGMETYLKYRKCVLFRFCIMLICRNTIKIEIGSGAGKLL